MVNQVVLLAGGKGTRMRELTETIPKPMVKVGELPVLEHLINIFEFFNDFSYLVASGYKGEIIDNHFKNFDNVKTIFTGDETNTGGRVFKLKDNLDDIFIVTYGDGLANVNINELIKFHNSHNKIGTITVTNPISRFGLVDFDNNNIVKKFIEKPKLDGFVNIGFMVFKKEILNYLDEDSTLETSPLINLSKDSELVAFTHDGYFEPMDTYREFLQLNKYWETGNPPWMDF
jgi:glucose-1-phosphate cytidylyltransferase